VEVSTNPLLSRGFTVRLAAFSRSLHEFELRRGAPVPEEFRAFGPLLERWGSAGKMFAECYVAGVTGDPGMARDVTPLMDLAALPLARTYRGGTFTIREGFEKDVPQWHWRHDLRPLLPPGIRRTCVSYWTESPLLSPVLVELFGELAAGLPSFYITDQVDGPFLELAFERPGLVPRGALIELPEPAMAVAADLHSDGEFFGGLLAAPEAPGGFEDPALPRTRFHEAAVRALGACRLYVRRLYDDECSWYSGEYEILSVQALPVREVLGRQAQKLGARILEIDRRFHRRLVRPLEL
jgi:hypothetical protein